MNLKNILEPILITYNRREFLKNTLEQLTADNSPIKNCEITILDNASTDGTKELCEEFCNSHTNFKYIRNKKNLGLSGNIIKAMELASKKWLWILCDDDEFDWQGWTEIEKALYEDYDIVLTGHTYVKNEIPYYINSSAFLPNVIYNTRNITDTVMINAYGIAHTLCPHHAIFCKVINENGKIFATKNDFTIVHARNIAVQNKDYSKMQNIDLYYKFANYNILQGYMNAYSLINNEKIRHECMDVLCQGVTFKESLGLFMELNPKGDINQIFEVLINANNRQRKDLIDKIFSSDNAAKSNYTKFMIQCFVFMLLSLTNCLRRYIVRVSFHSENTVIRIFGINFKIKKRRNNVNKRQIANHINNI